MLLKALCALQTLTIKRVCLSSMCNLLWCSHTLQDAQIQAPGKSIKDMNKFNLISPRLLFNRHTLASVFGKKGSGDE